MTTEQQPTRQRFNQAIVAVLSLTIAGLLMPFLAPSARAVDSVLLVDTLVDDPTATACTAAPTDCSLRGALINANTDGTVEIETISVPAGTYELTVPGGDAVSGSLNVSASVVIEGAGAGTTIIDANGLDRVLLVNGPGAAANRNLIASGLTFRGGRPCNEPGGDDGNNGGGGGLFIHGIAQLTDVIVEDNITCGVGGGIQADSFDSALTLTRSIVRGNTASQGAGGIESDFSLTMIDSTVSGNLADRSPGGGLRLAGIATISGSTISNNVATVRGGGITTGDDTTSACCAATVTITNSTISGNVVHWWNSGTPQYFPGVSGGIHVGRSRFTLRHVTVTANVAETNPNYGAVGRAAGISTGYANFLTLENSIVAGNVGNEECQFDVETTFAATGSFGCSAGGIQDPQLGPLADNGGLTKTHSVGAGSPAYDTADFDLCARFDQRGEPRPAGDACEMGAFELQVAGPDPTPTPSPDPTNAPTQPPLPTPEPTLTPDPTATPTQEPLPTPQPPDPTLPTISVDDVTITEGNTGSTSATFTVRLSRPHDSSVFVTVATANGTATAPADYAAFGPSQLAFAPGETTKSIDVQVAGDKQHEEPERFSVQLSNAFDATIARATGIGTIREPAFGPFNATATGNDWANAYLLALVSNYVYEDNAIPGTSASDFEAAFRARFDEPTDGIAVIDVFEDIVSQTQGAFLETDDALIVVLRGSEMPEWGPDGIDALVDAAAFQVGGVHAGFAAAATTVFPTVWAEASAARAAGKRVWLTGHSLGGALASVLGLQLQVSGVEVQGIYTYGAPKAFAFAAAAAYNAAFTGRPTVRWVNDLDPVPLLPPTVLTDYRHVGLVDNIIPGGPGATDCIIQLTSTERLAGADIANHASQQYLARIYANLPSDALRNQLQDPPIDPTAPSMRAGCNGFPATAETFARGAFVAGTNVITTAKQLAYFYGVTTAANLGQKLLTAGYNATQVSLALKGLLRLTAEQLISLLRTLGVSAKDLVLALRDAFALSANAIAQKLFNAGWAALDVARALRDALGSGIDAIADALHSAGFPGRDAVIALEAVFGLGAQIVATALQRVGYAALDVAFGLQAQYAYTLAATALANILRIAGFPANNVGDVLVSLYGFGAELVAATLKGAGFFVSHIAEHLRVGFGIGATQAVLILKGAGFDATAVATALLEVWNLDAQGVAKKLATGKFPATEVMWALRIAYGLGANAAAWAMQKADFAVTPVLTALRDVWGMTATTAAPVLAYARYTATQSISALKTVFGIGAGTAADLARAAGFAALDVASALQSVYTRTAAQVTDLLKHAGYDALAVAGALKGVFASTGAQVTGYLKAVGYDVGQITTAVKTTYSRTVAQMVTLLKDAGFDVTLVATGIKEAFGKSAAQIIGILADAGYNATSIAKALKVAYGKAASDVASLLWSAHYGIDQILTALQSAFLMTLAAALNVLRGLHIIP